MPGYIIVDIDIIDPVQYEKYKQMAGSSVAAHGGRYIVRGGPAQLLEGDQQPGRIVVLEFPTAAAARGWWDSPEYAEAKRLRQQCARTRMILVPGIDPIGPGWRPASPMTSGAAAMIRAGAAAVVLAGCGATTTPPHVCTTLYALIEATAVDSTGAIVTGLMISDTVLRTRQALAVAQDGLPNPGNYIIFEDDFQPDIRASGDSVKVTGTNGSIGFAANYVFGVPDGCHVSKVSGPDTVVVR